MTERADAMDPLERKTAVGQFQRLTDELDGLDEFDPADQLRDEAIRREMDLLWQRLDDIAMIQADPLRAEVDKSVRIAGRRVVDEGESARFLGRIYDPQLDEWDDLDSLVSWKRLDLSDPKHYAGAARYWDISRPQNMKLHDEYWTPRRVMDS